MTEKNEFKTWGIVEIMGHNRYAGFVTEQAIAGASFLRLDIPAVEGVAESTKYFGAAAIYAITPCTEETARLFAASWKSQPYSNWDVRQSITQELQANGKLLEHAQAQEYDDNNPF